MIGMHWNDGSSREIAFVGVWNMHPQCIRTIEHYDCEALNIPRKSSLFIVLKGQNVCVWWGLRCETLINIK